jgi:ATP-dependent helicase/nuclease subunit B
MLAGIGPIASEPWRVTDVLRLVRHEAAGLRTGRDRARPGHLHISTLDDAGADRRPFVFVVGLEEGRVFPAAREDPILLDRERAAINAALGDPPRLRLSLDRQQETIDRRLARLAAAGVEAARVVLSYSCRDTREFRDSYASWVVLNAFRLMRGDPALSYRQLHEWLGEAPASPLPVSAAAAATTAEWWMAQARRARDARAAILAAHPHLQQGLVAMQARAGDDFTIYDGLVPDAARLDPSRTGRLVSVSTLERLAGCPFRFFLEHGLQVNELDEHEPDADAWLDARTRGSELHVLYASVMRRAREQGRRVSVAADLAWARDQAALALQRLRVGMSPPSEAVFAREAEELLDDVEIFVADEASKAGVEPLGFEVEFGLGGSRLEPLNDPRPLELTLAPARVLRLRGRIDRIDRLAGGNAYQVVDYKTGVFRTAEYDGTYVMGTRLQPMIYGLAAEQLLQGDHPGARVVRGAYVFPTSRGFRTIKPIDLPPAESTVRVIELVLDVAAAGTFPAAPSEGPCRYCPLSRACGEAPQERTGRKIAATPLGAFRALRQVR